MKTIWFKEYIFEWEITSLSSTSIFLIFIFDYMSIYFLGLVSLIAGSVMIFSTSYMSHEVFFSRFIFLVFSFVMSMYLLILSPNLISLLLGWDGLGVTSYLLVIFYQSSKSFNAGMITALTNRLGDVGLLICISMMISMGDWTYSFISNMNNNVSLIFMFILITSACTKSAQIPFSAWLPAAMAAPTPVSALVHSSTLVTAGVYLLIRMNMLVSTTTISVGLMLMGTLTMVMAGFTAMFEMDMKKIIALSTLSQLGIMMMTLGAKMPLLSFFHLLSHAFFKAMLFMCAGMVIHNMKDYQNIRKMGNSLIALPLISSVMMIANLSLSGLPFLTGFYSKDLILEMMIMSNLSKFMFFLVMVGTFLTMAYSCRLSYLVSLSLIKSESCFMIMEGDKFMITGMLILMPFSIFGGMNLSWNLFSSNQFIFLPFWLKSSILMMILAAIMSMTFMFSKSFSFKNTKMSWFLGNMWFMPLTFSVFFSKMNLTYSKNFVKMIELSWTEMILFKWFFLLKDNNTMSKYFDSLNQFYIIKVVEIMMYVLLIMLMI
uniref:NADH-ubiquinone oxidoreductase chain 5 n=1 Tax=Undinula vulgaris TaxID=184747 RepID=A0A6B9D759_UNDVU|nr:NADH dehydrogenase subunit 5 [Undinula vulgaris]